MMAIRLGLEHCRLRKALAEIGNGKVENEPGIRSMSNCGALSKEFCRWRSVLCSQEVFGVDGGEELDWGMW